MTVIIDTGGRIFPILLVDPPWRTRRWSEKGNGRAPPYPTLTLEEIRTLRLPADRNAAVFLWTTSAFLEHAILAMRGWGCAYKSIVTWVKPSIGLGKCFRHRAEFMLYGTRGRLPPLGKPLSDSVIEAPRRRHSEKPARAYEIIERMYPSLSKIELFARTQREGWACWGEEVGGFNPAAGPAAQAEGPALQRRPGRKEQCGLSTTQSLTESAPSPVGSQDLS
jgi:N6-adenosine-specific RNA methylase IME4